MKAANNLTQKIIIGIIRVYQRSLSPDHGLLSIYYPFGCCRFRPTCSEYAIDSVKKFGAIKGSFKIIRRVIRCNPWNRGGSDPA